MITSVFRVLIFVVWLCYARLSTLWMGPLVHLNWPQLQTVSFKSLIVEIVLSQLGLLCWGVDDPHPPESLQVAELDCFIVHSENCFKFRLERDKASEFTTTLKYYVTPVSRATQRERLPRPHMNCQTCIELDDTSKSYSSITGSTIMLFLSSGLSGASFCFNRRNTVFNSRIIPALLQSLWPIHPCPGSTDFSGTMLL